MKFAYLFHRIPIDELEVKPLHVAGLRFPREHDHIQDNSRFRYEQSRTLYDRDIHLNGARKEIPTNAQLPFRRIKDNRPFSQVRRKQQSRHASGIWPSQKFAQLCGK